MKLLTNIIVSGGSTVSVKSYIKLFSRLLQEKLIILTMEKKYRYKYRFLF